MCRLSDVDLEIALQGRQQCVQGALRGRRRLPVDDNDGAHDDRGSLPPP
jgi:hypothetical protein